MSKHTPPHHHTHGYDPACTPCNAPLTLEKRSPIEKAGYLLACLARGTTSATDYDYAAGVLTVEAILDASREGDHGDHGPELDDIIRSAKSPDDYADHDTHIYALYDLIERLAGEVQRLRTTSSSSAK